MRHFAPQLPHPNFIIPPSIDPLSEKNRELSANEIEQSLAAFNFKREAPIILQVSRFDRFKDPLGVVQAYKIAKKFMPELQLILAGGGASDDPEGQIVFNDVQKATANDPDIHLLYLPSNAHRTINALQRMADIVLQKSIKEGFGLTVSEALWKRKPVIGGDVGGIRLQIINKETGFLVRTPEEAADKMRFLLQNRKLMQELGNNGHELVKKHFLTTRQLRDYLDMIVKLRR